MSTYRNPFLKITSSSLAIISGIILCSPQLASAQVINTTKQENASKDRSKSMRDLEIIRNTSALIDKAIDSDLIK